MEDNGKKYDTPLSEMEVAKLQLAKICTMMYGCICRESLARTVQQFPGLAREAGNY